MQIGQYTKIRDMGEGGMGTVTLGYAPDGGLVVIKRPHPNQPDLKMRIVDEANLGLMLHHPHLVETLDLFFEHDQPNLVVRFVPGTNLTQIRQRAAKVPLGLLARIGRQISEALAAIHNASSLDGRLLNAVHRDVTPGNVLLDKGGNARLIDLGIARCTDSKAEHTQEGFIRGTLRYLPPEAFGDDGFGPQGDLWSLGLVLHEAARGRRTFNGSDVEVVGRIIAFPGLPDDDELDPRLFAILNRLMTVDSDERVQSAEQAAHLFSQLERVAGDDVQVAHFLAEHVPSSAFEAAVDPGNSPLETASTSLPEISLRSLEAPFDAPIGVFWREPWDLPVAANLVVEPAPFDLAALAAQELAAMEAWNDETWSRPIPEIRLAEVLLQASDDISSAPSARSSRVVALDEHIACVIGKADGPISLTSTLEPEHTSSSDVEAVIEEEAIVEMEFASTSVEPNNPFAQMRKTPADELMDYVLSLRGLEK
ncbi:MAG: serine/threonine protein kinase [Deltaproteobacteria bacterium]|nr:serine/threonine protein kinase [Deltaproteobacteria bacterium]